MPGDQWNTNGRSGSALPALKMKRQSLPRTISPRPNRSTCSTVISASSEGRSPTPFSIPSNSSYGRSGQSRRNRVFHWKILPIMAVVPKNLVHHCSPMKTPILKCSVQSRHDYDNGPSSFHLKLSSTEFFSTFPPCSNNSLNIVAMYFINFVTFNILISYISNIVNILNCL